MNYHFFAMLFRMKYIDRWQLMRNTIKESLSEHTLETAFIAHALAVIENNRNEEKIDTEKVVLSALFHDVPEVITGDLPTPVKYYDKEIKNAYDKLEESAIQKMLTLLPDDLTDTYSDIMHITDPRIKQFVKAADKISALIKCREELALGNKEFSVAEKSTLESIKALNLPAADMFVKDFLESFSLPLDIQSK